MIPRIRGASTSRSQPARSEVEARRAALLAIVAEGRPMTVRHVFYQATIHLVAKSEDGYRRVQADLVVMRRDGTLPYDWLADNTHWQRKPQTFDSVEAALRDTAHFYRKACSTLIHLSSPTWTWML